MIPEFDFYQMTDDMEMDTEDILHLMTIYQTEIQKDLNELEGYLSNLDWPQIKAKLHKMKGDSANMCLSPFADIFTEMEDCSVAKNSDVLLLKLNQTKAMKTQLISAFQKYSTQVR